jgi:hypothetical protein
MSYPILTSTSFDDEHAHLIISHADEADENDDGQQRLMEHLESKRNALKQISGVVDCTNDGKAREVTLGIANWTRFSPNHVIVRVDSHQAPQFWCEAHFTARSRDEIVPREPFVCNLGRITKRGDQRLMCKVDDSGLLTFWDASVNPTTCYVTTQVPDKMPEVAESTLAELELRIVEEYVESLTAEDA